jgi:hypothetical protein
MAVSGSILNVKGIVNATDIVMDIPGRAPKKHPMLTPPKMAAILAQVKKYDIPA